MFVKRTVYPSRAPAVEMIAEINTRGRKLGVEWGELGWTLEDNAPVNLAIRAMRAKVYKTYRVYDKNIEG